MVGEGIELGELPIDAGGQDKRIEPIAEPHERGDLGRVGLGTHAHAVERHVRGVIAAAQARAHPDFALELHRREEEILE